MDLSKMIAELQDERHRLDEAIEALERLSVGQNRRRGRPSRNGDDPVEEISAPGEGGYLQVRPKKPSDGS